jgi:hypothetical protein
MTDTDGSATLLRQGRVAGSLTVELVVLTPLIVLFALLALASGRYEVAREQVIAAAQAGADAAAVVASPGDAQWAATTAATAVVSGQSHSCARLTVSADTSRFVPGGSVRVVVSCQIDWSDLLVPGVPGRTTVEVGESAPIDPFRSVQ